MVPVYRAYPYLLVGDAPWHTDEATLPERGMTFAACWAHQVLSDEKVKEALDAMCRARHMTQRESRGRKKQRTKETAVAASGPDLSALARKYESELARMRKEQGRPVEPRPEKKRWETPRPSVLLVDEVDVFFGDGFFGQPYQPSVNIDTEDGDGYKLLRHIWQERETYRKELLGLYGRFLRIGVE